MYNNMLERRKLFIEMRTKIEDQDFPESSRVGNINSFGLVNLSKLWWALENFLIRFLCFLHSWSSCGLCSCFPQETQKMYKKSENHEKPSWQKLEITILSLKHYRFSVTLFIHSDWPNTKMVLHDWSAWLFVLRDFSQSRNICSTSWCLDSPSLSTGFYLSSKKKFLTRILLWWFRVNIRSAFLGISPVKRVMYRT